MTAGAGMWESKMFTKDQMVAWENKPPPAANLAESPGLLHRKMARAKTIFASHRKTVMVQGCSPCSPRAGSGSGRRQDTAMMFALLQEQHKAQLEAMAAANK
jgi:hypothetical protein